MLKVSQKFYFEHSRKRGVTSEESTSNSDQAQQETRKITSYTEAGEAVYEDGTIEKKSDTPVQATSNDVFFS